MSTPLATNFAQYGRWREQLGTHIDALHSWLIESALGEDGTLQLLPQARTRLRDDRLLVAFVAEFSRGKSELINAIFFADYPQRILPSAAGRTTMCPTELYYDAAEPVSLRLLPIATRRQATPLSELREQPEHWHRFKLDPGNPGQLRAALAQLAATRRLPVAEAESLGLIDPDDAGLASQIDTDGTVDVPVWRHALINFPHPLLAQGLVILDTPGLNALGTEPELTLKLLPSAHAVLFVLAADTGVTRSDADVWRRDIATATGRHSGRLVVLNKIDSLWDALKTTDQIDAEIDRQVQATAAQLGLPATQIYPVSAQKALQGKLQHDQALLARSRLPALESALAGSLIPNRIGILRESVMESVETVVVKTTELLESRLASLQDQIDELQALRGKNREAVTLTMMRANEERQHFENGLTQFNALRSVYTHHAQHLREHLGLATLKQEIRRTRLGMEKSLFSHGLRSAMAAFFDASRGNMERADTRIQEIQAMMRAMYRNFSEHHGLAAVSPPEFQTTRYLQELQSLQQRFEARFNTVLTMLTQAQTRVIGAFFETLASQVVRIYEAANRDAEAWLKSLMAPMESQVREHQAQLKRRLESVQRIHAARDTLDERIIELETDTRRVSQQLDELGARFSAIQDALQPQPAARRPHAHQA